MTYPFLDCEEDSEEFRDELIGNQEVGDFIDSMELDD